MTEDYNVCAVSISGHEAGVCILRNGEVYEQLLEERLSGHKADNHLFHVYKHIRKFHDTYGINELVYINGDDKDIGDMMECLADKFSMQDIPYETNVEEHHLFHASSGFYSSGFDEAIVLVIDGWGADYRVDKVMEMAGVELNETQQEESKNFNDTLFLESTSIYHASYPCGFQLLHKYMMVPAPHPRGFIEVNFPSDFFEMLQGNTNINANSAYDIGVMYGTITHHLGWIRDECGKTMGLAAYGKENPNLPPFILDHNNMLCANMNLFYSNRLINTTNYPEMRHNDDFQKKADIAYKIQKTMEHVLVKRIEQILDNDPPTKNIVFSGGCALNICANSIVQEKFPDINFYVDPIAGDACQAYGAAALYYHDRTGSLKRNPLKTVYHGLRENTNLNLMRKKIELAVAKENKFSSSSLHVRQN